MTELVGRAERWPVGLYLAALAHRAGGQPGNAGFAFTGDDRFLADYLHAELLTHLPAERVAFLTRTAVLERMSGPLCDAVLDTHGSDRVLAELEDSNLLLAPLDRRREMLRALLCRDDVDRMWADALEALAGLSPASSWRATAVLLAGVAEVLDGRVDRADVTLAEAVEVGTDLGALPATATALAEQAVGIVVAGHLDDYIMSALARSVAARTALHRGAVPAARDHLARAARLRPLLTYAIPTLAVQTLLELGRAYVALSDVAGAKAVLGQARDVLRVRRDLGVLPAQVEELWSSLDVARRAGLGGSSLTAAELRLLPLLATHLTFREIGQRLYLSQHTVKTQAISVYRKLGVSSRGQAVRRVQEAGLLGA